MHNEHFSQLVKLQITFAVSKQLLTFRFTVIGLYECQKPISHKHLVVRTHCKRFLKIVLEFCKKWATSIHMTQLLISIDQSF